MIVDVIINKMHFNKIIRHEAVSQMQDRVGKIT